MAEKTQNERRNLGRVLLTCSAITGVLAVFFLIRLIFLRNDPDELVVPTAFSATMLYGAFLGIGLNYTIRVPRGKEDDKNQVIAGMVMALLGTAICVSMHIVYGGGAHKILPIAYYAQSAVILIVCVLSLKFYKK